MSTTYSADQFAQILRAQETVECGATEDDQSYEQMVIVAALRIAARVMRPGMIGNAMLEYIKARDKLVMPVSTAKCEDVIRAALTEDGNG